jgi:hypothetical protein
MRLTPFIGDACNIMCLPGIEGRSSALFLQSPEPSQLPPFALNEARWLFAIILTLTRR